MAIITYPTNLAFGTFEQGIRRFDLQEYSETSGSIRERLLAPPRWTFRIGPPSAPGATMAQIGLWRGMIAALQGSVNYLAVYDPTTTLSRGTMTGTLSCSALAKGATSITVSGGTSGQTVLQGDIFQVGTGLNSQMIMATSSGTVSGGSVTFSFANPARIAYSGGTTVKWDKPLCHCKLSGNSASWSYQAGNYLAGGMIVDLIEQWEY